MRFFLILFILLSFSFELEGASPGYIFFPNENTLQRAVYESNLKEVKAYLKKGVNVNTRGKYGRTPLHWVRNVEIAKLLIEKGADMNVKDSRYKAAPLHTILAPIQIRFSMKGNIWKKVRNIKEATARFLVKSGADVNVKTENNVTPLHLVGDVETAKLLIEHGADVNAQRDNGMAPLHYLVIYKEIARLLIEHGADVNAKTKENMTPLHLVGDVETAKLLIEHGADVNAKNHRGRTPYETVFFKELKKVLKENGGKKGLWGKIQDFLKWNE